MSTAAERTVRVRSENRFVFVDRDRLDTSKGRTVRVPEENRTVKVERQETAGDRTVYANED